MRRWLTWWGGIAVGLLVAWGAVALAAGDGTVHPAVVTRVEVRMDVPQDAPRVVAVPRTDDDSVRATVRARVHGEVAPGSLAP
jgi:hypothetical protein